jgi:hypothetical protein
MKGKIMKTIKIGGGQRGSWHATARYLLLAGAFAAHFKELDGILAFAHDASL